MIRYKKIPSMKNTKPFIDKSKQNAGGYYEGMPGVQLDNYGNRVMAYFVVTPEGKSHMVMHSMDKQIKTCIQESMQESMTRSIIHSASVDEIMNKRSPFNWFLRTAYKTKMIMQRLKNRKKMKQQLKAQRND